MNKWLWGVVALGLILRVVGLSSHPAGFTPDEASFGYDAYSLIHTGADQWGHPWPLTFKSFGDYKLPLYTYLTIPSVLILGLNEFAIRLPNALFGAISVLGLYFLVIELCKSFKFDGIHDKKLALLSSFILAVSPWHIMLSRGAFESNLTVFFMTFGLLFFFKALTNSKFQVLSALFFGLNLFTYHSARLLTLPVVFYLIFLFRRQILKSKHFLISGSVLLAFLAVAVITLFQGAGVRASTSTIFNPTDGWGGVSDSRYKEFLSGTPDIIARVFNNKFIYPSTLFVDNYLSYFSKQFFFTQGPAEYTYGMVPGMGLLYLFEIFFLAAFVWRYCRKGYKDSHFLLFWFFVSPIAASITKGPGYAANRVAFMMPSVQIMLAIGVLYLLNFVKKYIQIRKIAFLSFTIFTVSLLFFLHGYLVSQKIYGVRGMVYGAREIFKDLDDSSYREIIVSKKLSEPQIYLAFYKKIDPVLVQTASVDWKFEDEGKAWVDQLGNYSLGKYTFKNIDYKNDSRITGRLFIGVPDDFPENISPKKIIKYPDSSPAYYFVDTKEVFVKK